MGDLVVVFVFQAVVVEIDLHAQKRELQSLGDEAKSLRCVLLFRQSGSLPTILDNGIEEEPGLEDDGLAEVVWNMKNKERYWAYQILMDEISGPQHVDPEPQNSSQTALGRALGKIFL